MKFGLNANFPLLRIAVLFAILKVLTTIFDYGMMKRLDKRYKRTEEYVDPKGEQRGRLSSNTVSVRCSPLDFLDTSADNVTEDMILDYLARIISDIYLRETYGNISHKKSGDLLPGINKGAS